MHYRIQKLINEANDITGIVHSDIVYLDRFSKRYKLDLYEPLVEYQKGKAPIIVFIHGGSWHLGSKDMIRIIDSFTTKMRKYGYFVASIDYVSGPFQGIISGAVNNAAKAIEFICANSQKYGYSQNEIGLYGVSAGGHVAFMLGLKKLKHFNFNFILSEFAPVDMVAMSKGDAFGSSKILQFIPKPILRNLSPIEYISHSMPPVFMLHGTQDTIVHINQSENFYEKAKQHYDKIEYRRIKDGDHGFLNLDKDEWARQEDEVMVFIKEHFNM